MNLKSLCNDKGFLYLITTFLKQSDLVSSSVLYSFEINDDEISNWFELYDTLISDKSKIVKLDRMNSYFFSFMLIYIFYLTQVDNTKVIIVQKDRDFSRDLLSILTKLLDMNGVEGSKILSSSLNKITLTNKSTVTFLKLGTYNIKSLSNADLIYFAPGEILNTEKLIFDLNELNYLGEERSKKTILAISNDLKLDYIKKIK